MGRKRLKVIIPAAGGGTRLKPHTDLVPKVLLPVADKPIIGHIVAMLGPLNPEEVIVIVGKQGDAIRRYLSRIRGLHFRYALQAEPEGLGHAVAQAQPYITNEPVLILLGDTIVEMDLTRFCSQGNALAVCPVKNPSAFGIVEQSRGRVTRVQEKPARPKSNLAIVGVYFFENGAPLFQALNDLITSDIRTRGEYQLTDALQLLIRQGLPIKPRPVKRWLDCGTPEAMLMTNRYLLERQACRLPLPRCPTSLFLPPVYVHPRARVEHSVVGPNVSIAAGSRISNSVLSDAIVFERALVTDAVVKRSLIGRGMHYQGSSGLPGNQGITCPSLNS